MSITQATYQAVVTEDADSPWELHRGRLYEQPSMSFTHNDLMNELGFVLRSQLPRAEYRVRVNAGRLRHADQTYFIPDLFVVPVETVGRELQHDTVLEVYDAPMPFVVEVWSPSTGDYDIDRKIPEYRARGDLEIWRVHPAERQVTIWSRRDDGGYDERRETGGVATLSGLPGIAFDPDALFDLG
jgi:Uma2 family endonuclease